MRTGHQPVVDGWWQPNKSIKSGSHDNVRVSPSADSRVAYESRSCQGRRAASPSGRVDPERNAESHTRIGAGRQSIWSRRNCLVHMVGRVPPGGWQRDIAAARRVGSAPNLADPTRAGPQPGSHAHRPRTMLCGTAYRGHVASPTPVSMNYGSCARVRNKCRWPSPARLAIDPRIRTAYAGKTTLASKAGPSPSPSAIRPDGGAVPLIDLRQDRTRRVGWRLQGHKR